MHTFAKNWLDLKIHTITENMLQAIVAIDSTV